MVTEGHNEILKRSSLPLYTVNSTVQTVQSVQLEAKCRKQAPLLQSSATIALRTNLGTYLWHNISSLPEDSMKTSEHSWRFILSMSDKTCHIYFRMVMMAHSALLAVYTCTPVRQTLAKCGNLWQSSRVQPLPVPPPLTV